MFGMGGNKTRGAVDYSYDLENELKQPGKLKAYQEHIQEQVNQLKKLLREGSDKKSFSNAQQLLQGYLAVQKVLQRAGRKTL